MNKTKNKQKDSRLNTLVMSRLHFYFVGIYMLQIVIFDSWNLITHENVGQRWTIAGVLLAVNTVVWFLANIKDNKPLFYQMMLLLLVVADTIFVGFNVYWERGMISISVAMYAVPLVLAGSLRSRSALLAAAAVSAASYSTAVVRYFNDNYGEGFRVQLYGTVAFYVALFFVISRLLMHVSGAVKDS